MVCAMPRPQGIEKLSFVEIKMMKGGSPPRVGGDVGGFGHVGEARACYDAMAQVMKRLVEIRDNAEMDSINVEKYVKELTNAMIDVTKATGRCSSRSTSR